MDWRYGPFFIPLLLTALVGILVSVMLLPRRHTPGVKSMIALMASLAFWSVAYILELGSVWLEDKLFWANLIYSAQMIIPVIWLYFALAYTGYAHPMSRYAHHVALWGIPLLTILLIWTNPLHHLVRRAIYTRFTAGLNVFTFDYGPWFWVSIAWDYALLLTGSILLIRATRKPTALHRRQTALLIAAIALPWLANIEYAFGRHTLSPLDPSPVAYTISGVIIAIGFWRLGLFELVPAACQTLIEAMEDGWIVMDREGHIVDVNQAGCRILGAQGPAQIIGRYASDLFPSDTHTKGDLFSVALPSAEGLAKYYDVRRAPVRDKAGRRVGELLVMRDVSKRVQFEEEQARLIEELNNALAQVKTLSGLLPICAICKKIRNDAGYWTEVEEYISAHSDADFTHGICPDCMARFYPDLIEHEEEPISQAPTEESPNDNASPPSGEDKPFAFFDPGPLADGDLTLALRTCLPGNPTRGWAPSYEFEMRRTADGTPMGNISLRVGTSDHIVLYAGHIGYEVFPEYRGHHYAARACRLLLPLALRHGLEVVWITCDPDNWASRRTCELAGARFVEIVRVPPTDVLYLMGHRWKCRYRLDTRLWQRACREPLMNAQLSLHSVNR